MKKSILKRAKDHILSPNSRLAADFPFDFKKMGKAYLFGNLYFFLGSLFPVLLLIFFSQAAIYFDWKYGLDLLTELQNIESGPGSLYMVVLMLSSFLCGFSLEVSYLNRVLKKDGFSFRKLLHLDLSSIKGSSRFKTWLALAKFVIAGFVIVLALNNLAVYLFGPAEQETISIYENLSGGSLAIFIVIAVILAPLFEEIVFRGFFFQGIRCMLRKGVFGRVLGYSTGKADFIAVVVSSAIFAIMHFQFQATTVICLFVMGVVLAEVYRRSGTLLAAIALHLVNNGIVVISLSL